jgi:hypothetical protein
MSTLRIDGEPYQFSETAIVVFEPKNGPKVTVTFEADSGRVLMEPA